MNDQGVIIASTVSKRFVKYEDTPLLVTSALRLGRRTRRDHIWALRDVSFSVGTGQTLGVIGRNGSGKTTLLRLLAGVTAPTEGRIRVRGRVAPLIAVGVGFHPELTGRENVFVNGVILGHTKRQVEQRFDEVVDFAEIQDFIDTPVKFYSSGMFVRLAFGASIMADPEVLLVDEVLAVGDAAFQLKCFDRMESLRARGTTVVVVSHNLAAIRRMCDRTLVLHDGVLRYDGPTEDAISVYYDLLGTYGLDDDPPSATLARSTRGRRLAGEVLEFDLLDGTGRSTRHFSADDPIEITLTVHFQEPVDGVVAAVNVHSETGIQVYSETSRWRRTYGFAAGTTGRLSVKLAASLAGGSYTAVLSLAQLDGTPVVAPPRPLLFFVHGRGFVKGVADLHAAFEFEGAELPVKSVVDHDGALGEQSSTGFSPHPSDRW